MIIKINVFTAQGTRKLLTTALEIFCTLVITQYPNKIPAKLHECNLEPFHIIYSYYVWKK